MTVYCNDATCFDETELQQIHDSCIGTPTFQGVTFYQRATREEQDRYRRIIFNNNRLGNEAFKRELSNPSTLTDYHKVRIFAAARCSLARQRGGCARFQCLESQLRLSTLTPSSLLQPAIPGPPSFR